MADLIQISDQASKSIKENLFNTLQENWWRTSDNPIMSMIGMEKVDQASGMASRPRVQRVQTVGSGRDVEILHEHSLFGGGYGVAEGGSLRYGQRAEARSKSTMKFYEGGFQITRQDIAATANPQFALVNALSRHAVNAMHQAQRDVGRMTSYLTTGILAYVNGAVTASINVNVDNGGTEETDPVRYLVPTRKILVDTTSAITGGTAAVNEVASVTDINTFVVTTADTFADNDSIVSASVYDTAGSTYTEFASMDALIAATGTVQNVNKATNYWFQSYVSAVGGALAITSFDTIAVNIRKFAKNPGNMFFMGNSTQYRRYSALLQATKRVSTVRKDFDGMLTAGAQKLTYFAPDGEIPFFLCEDVPDGVVYAIDPDGYMWAEMLPLGFSEDALSMEGTSGQRIQGSNKYEFAFRMYGNLVQLNAKSSGKLTGITS